MFGKLYANHLDILMHSFGEMNEHYIRPKAQTDSPILAWLKQRYIRLFGIPEIGFQIRSKYFQTIVNRYVSPASLSRILDAGSGIGAYTFFLANKYPHAFITGGDIAKAKLAWCKTVRSELAYTNTTFQYFDVTKTRHSAKQDLIVSIDVLEHVPDYRAALKNFSKQLVRGGYLYIHVPQPKQRRLFESMRTWEHADHVREGLTLRTLRQDLTRVGLSIVASKQTFGFFGKLAWELNHMTLSKNFILAGIAYPILYLIGSIDLMATNKRGLCIAVLAKKK